MSKFFINGETSRVSFEDGEWVDVKQEFSQADLDYITTKMMQAKVTTDGKKPETDLSLTFGKQATLERGIQAWSFADGETAIPVNPDNISNLRNKYRQKVLAEIDRLNSEAGSFAKN